MEVSARLRNFPVLALAAFGLLASAPHARADDAFVLSRHLPTLGSLAAPAHPQTPAPVAMASAEPICDIFANGYDPTGATPCAGCFDATLDFTETDIDCGGIYCKACADGKHCAVGSDCSSTVCNTSTAVCAPATCADGIKDGSETAVDCGGGVCPACGNGLGCIANSDCLSNACDANSLTCVSNQCLDHRLDGAETDVDCGGGTCPTCAVGKMCTLDGDCTTMACDYVTSRCVTSRCFDQRKDGNETDIDCGGGTCTTCANGLKCIADTDCTSNACDANSLTCVSDQCSDHRQDGLETDVDCGGGICSACVNGLKCNIDSDCLSNACDAISNLCVSNQCIDHRKDGVETDVDCGGANTCARCAVGKSCISNSDCQLGHTCSTGAPHVCQ